MYRRSRVPRSHLWAIGLLDLDLALLILIIFLMISR